MSQLPLKFSSKVKRLLRDPPLFILKEDPHSNLYRELNSLPKMSIPNEWGIADQVTSWRDLAINSPVEIGHCKVHLLGAHHASAAATEFVQQTLSELNPDLVIIEPTESIWELEECVEKMKSIGITDGDTAKLGRELATNPAPFWTNFLPFMIREKFATGGFGELFHPYKKNSQMNQFAMENGTVWRGEFVSAMFWAKEKSVKVLGADLPRLTKKSLHLFASDINKLREQEYLNADPVEYATSPNATSYRRRCLQLFIENEEAQPTRRRRWRSNDALQRTRVYHDLLHLLYDFNNLDFDPELLTTLIEILDWEKPIFAATKLAMQKEARPEYMWAAVHVKDLWLAAELKRVCKKEQKQRTVVFIAGAYHVLGVYKQLINPKPGTELIPELIMDTRWPELFKLDFGFVPPPRD